MKQSGIAIAEIVLVVLIIGAMVVMIIPRMTGRSDETKQAEAKSDVQSYLATALKLYELDNGNFPTTAQGLKALFKKPTVAPIPSKWRGPYIEKRPIDPWGQFYVYLSPGENRIDYDLSSKGKDTDNDEDDIVNWE